MMPVVLAAIDNNLKSITYEEYNQSNRKTMAYIYCMNALGTYVSVANTTVYIT
jgi:hypothetical protein